MSTRLQVLLLIAVIIYFLIILYLMQKGKIQTQYALVWLLSAVVLLVVASIIWTIFVKGIGAISWEMVSSAPGKNWNTADD